MSLSDPLSSPAFPAPFIPARRGPALAFALVMGAAVLAGCGGSGFQPLYGKTASGQQMTEVLANLDVALIPGRVGQRVRNDLLFYKNGGGDAAAPAKPDYRLEIAIRQYSQAVLVTSTGLAGGAILSLDASFKIIRIKDNKAVFTANSYARAPFETNKVTDPFDASGTSTGRSVFANVRASYDAENRAAASLASDIRTRVAAFLSGAT